MGIVLTTGGSYSQAQDTISRQAQKAFFILDRLLSNFVKVTLRHVWDLFDKLISPILKFGPYILP